MWPLLPHALVLLATLLTLPTSPARAESVGLKIRLGAIDEKPTDWSGQIDVFPGEVAEIHGWRFDLGDRVVGRNSWRAKTRAGKKRRRTNHPEKARVVTSRPFDNGITVRLEDVNEDSIVVVTSMQGQTNFRLGDLELGTIHKGLDGHIEVERTAASQQLTSSPAEDDFAAVAVGPDDRTHVAWTRFTPSVSNEARVLEYERPPKNFDFLAKPQGSDQVWLATLTPSGLEDETPVTASGKAVFGTAIAVDGDNRVWTVWSERRGEAYQVWARARKAGVFSEPVRLSAGDGNAHSPVATTDSRGRVWIAWQAVHDRVLQVFVSRQIDDGSFGPPERVSPHERSAWAPAITATPPGAAGDPRVAVVWDTYERGDYDVWLREYELDGRAHDAVAAANSDRYEARASAAYDPRGNLWLVWEDGGPTWGKDTGPLDKAGTGILGNRRLGLIVRAPDGAWLQPAGDISASMPRATTGAIPKRKEGEPLSEAARAAIPYLSKPYHNLSRLVIDREGRPWLLLRSRAIDFRPTVGSMWLGWALFYDGDRWTGPVLIPNSSNLLYAAPAAVASPSGGLTIVYPTDHRQTRSALLAVVQSEDFEARRGISNPWINDLFAGRISAKGPTTPPELVPASTPPSAAAFPTSATEDERSAIAHARNASTNVRGKQWSLLRGEFHRHTEFSSDGGSDGPLQDMWRYAIDVADLDWVGNGDHDSGHGRLYPWWLIQKTTDAFHVPDRFTTVYSYERSRPYPEGHRNVVFIRRGIRPLPRLPLAKVDDEGPAADTEMYYDYVRKFGGVSAPHTSATTMGTDWRNRNDAVEPVVEIYQGSRNSYEMPGAPRTAKAGFKKSERAKGFISNALAKGYRLGFISSSDHHSTHISYAMLWVENPTREAILDAFRKRRVYAATDDIVADVRMVGSDSEWFMGEELEATTAPTMRIRLDGTDAFARVVVVKDGKEVQVFEPNQKNVRLEWTDPDAKAGSTSHYYVRGEQVNRELVWTSPIWITYGDGA